jgi:hypothetical protein
MSAFGWVESINALYKSQKGTAKLSHYVFSLSRTSRVSADIADGSFCELILATVLSIAFPLCLAGL